MEEKTTTTVTADVEYVQGYLRSAHRELELTNEELEKFKKMSNEEQIQYMEENGEIIIDDVSIEDCGDVLDINY